MLAYIPYMDPMGLSMGCGGFLKWRDILTIVTMGFKIWKWPNFFGWLLRVPPCSETSMYISWWKNDGYIIVIMKILWYNGITINYKTQHCDMMMTIVAPQWQCLVDDDICNRTKNIYIYIMGYTANNYIPIINGPFMNVSEHGPFDPKWIQFTSPTKSQEMGFWDDSSVDYGVANFQTNAGFWVKWMGNPVTGNPYTKRMVLTLFMLAMGLYCTTYTKFFRGPVGP